MSAVRPNARLGLRGALIWAALAAALAVPTVVAASSPLLAYRQWPYVIAGLAGVVALALLLVQPLLAGGALPGLSARAARAVHRWLGPALLGLVVAHVALLWVTSPPDVIDALLLRSPTPFSVWGVAGLAALVAAAGVAALRRRLSPLTWRRLHAALVATVVVTSVVHAMLIEGTMGWWSKAMLCALALAATGWALSRLRLVRRARAAPVRG